MKWNTAHYICDCEVIVPDNNDNVSTRGIKSLYKQKVLNLI